MLTKKQHELLLFINRRLGDSGICPSFDEMKEALGLKSKSGVHRLITGLEERGFIRRLAHRARALEVARLPENMATTASSAAKEPAAPRPAFAPNVLRGDFGGALPGAAVAQPAETTRLPLYGKIAAGTPNEALRDNSQNIDVPASLLGRGEHYALQVEGDSMLNAGILDGDTVVI